MERVARLEVRDHEERENLTVTIEGELDLSTVPELERHVEARIGGRETTLTLDMRGVTFMDSSGLRFLITLSERAEREGWTVRLLAPEHEAATQVLRITGADDALPFEKGP